MAQVLETRVDDTTGDLTDLPGAFPATVTVTRTSQADFKSRQLNVWIDGEATLLWGDSVTTELRPGRHRVCVSQYPAPSCCW